MTPWTSRCESGNCVETRPVHLADGGEYVEVRDSEMGGSLLVTVAAWAAHEAALRAEALKVAARSLLAEAEAYDAKWNRHPVPGSSDWDKGYVAGMQRAAHDVANSIDRPGLTEVHDDEKGNSDGQG